MSRVKLTFEVVVDGERILYSESRREVNGKTEADIKEVERILGFTTSRPIIMALEKPEEE